MKSHILLMSLLGLALFFGLGISPLQAQESHPFTVNDLLTMERISEPLISPDGQWVVFVLRTTDMEANRGRTDLWLADTTGKSPRRLTSHQAADYSPLWSADGKTVYFLSTRSGSAQVWAVPVNGGEAVQITDLPLDVESFLLSPKGERLLLSLQVFPSCTTLEETVKELAKREKSKVTGQLYDELFIRHWDTWGDGRRSHLFTLPLGGGEPVDLMKGMTMDSPTKPFGGREEYTFTPDGQEVVFTARRGGSQEAWSTNYDLWRVRIDGSKPAEAITTNPAWDTTPVFSPDGRTMAYLAMERAGYEADRYRIVLREWASGKERVLTQGWDRSCSSILWSQDGKSLYTVAEELGQRKIFSLERESGKVTPVVEKGYAGSPSLSGKTLVYALEHLKSPVQLFVLEGKGKPSRQITWFNKEKLEKIRFGEPEQFSFIGAGGDKVYGYTVKPADFDPSRKYPVAFLIHGGPQGSFGNDFHYRWNPQTYAGGGYAVVMVDFHGSTGYGQKFTDAINGDWGGKPLEDLQKGLEAAIAKNSWMDGERVCALGASYGGYMINWIAGMWPDRFRCLVCHDGNLDERMAYFDTEELWFPEWEHKGTPWENPEGYAKHNPIDLVKNWKTPTLVVHGGRDYRVVDTQGISTFTALQRKGIPSRFLYFPDENHWVLQPQNSLLWHETVLQWLDRWTKK